MSIFQDIVALGFVGENGDSDIQYWNHNNHIRIKGTEVPLSISAEEIEHIGMLIEKHNLKCGYELATAFGVSAVAAGLGFLKTGGKLLSVDAYIEEMYNDAGIYKGKQEIFKEARGLKSAKFLRNHFGLDNVITFEVGWSPTDIPTLAQKFLKKDEKFDYVFIDAGHFEDQILADIQAILPYTADKCLWIFHDVYEHVFGGKIKTFLKERFGKEIVPTLVNGEKMGTILIENAVPVIGDRFEDHYIDWRNKRINAVIERYGTDFFKGKKVLELGAGYGHIGKVFREQYGAIVTFTEARAQYLSVIKEMNPDSRVFALDLESINDIERLDDYDFIIHWGVMYHQFHESVEPSLRILCRKAPYMTIETQVIDTKDPMTIVHKKEPQYVEKHDSEGALAYDQSYSTNACSPSAAFVERILTEEGMKFERITNSLDSAFHNYSWPEQDNGKDIEGRRRFWFCERENKK